MMSFLLGYSPVGQEHDDVPDVFSSFAKWKNRPETPPTIVGEKTVLRKRKMLYQYMTLFVRNRRG